MPRAEKEMKMVMMCGWWMDGCLSICSVAAAASVVLMMPLANVDVLLLIWQTNYFLRIHGKRKAHYLFTLPSLSRLTLEARGG